ncbi:hypothetical protein N1M2_63 [Klebsiella phage N1M2]|uniref:HNH nuclease domain-containing protein n=1 Tax=Klebsiella phage N1M2 TaxID=2664939 RepID=A0A6B7ZEN0_9CAUD|nr:HNH endonuclease [Klebsiella phage N1M2]QGH71926.1 hypothetical protein N1M2_63 [Klebsiella phage N1M2]
MTILIYKDTNFDMFTPIQSVLGVDDLSEEEKVRAREEHIKEQLLKNPRYYCWDYLNYYRTTRDSDLKEGELYQPYIMVSSRGEIAWWMPEENEVHVTTGTHSANYLMTHIYDDEKEAFKNIYIHRAVASTFISKKESHKDIPYSKLQVNHKDGNKLCPHFGNLEWSTQSENRQHAIDTGLVKSGIDDPNTKPVLGTVVVDSMWKGTQFVIYGRTAIKNLGLDPASIQQTVSGKAKTTYGCSWSYITREEAATYTNTIPPQLLDRMVNDGVTLLSTTKPVMGTIVIPGKHQGDKFVCYGGKELTKYGFQQAHVSRATKDPSIVRSGCVWEYVDLRKAETLPRGITEEQRVTLFGK